MNLSSEAADANAAAGFELLVETFYSGNKEESTAATLLLRRHCIMTRSSVRSACTRPEGSLIRDFCHEALLQASCGNNRPGHLERSCHGNTPALLSMLLLRRHCIITRSSVRSACTRPEGSLMRDFCHEALLQASCGNNRPGHLERACHGNTPALLSMKTRLPKRIVPRDQSPSLRSSAAAAAYLIFDFRGVAWGLLLGTSFASTKRIVRGIVKGGPALRASMFILLTSGVSFRNCPRIASYAVKSNSDRD
jgi:hypothetical protein